MLIFFCNFFSGNVNCGGHRSSSCKDCGPNESFCNFDCKWNNAKKECLPKSSNILRNDFTELYFNTVNASQKTCQPIKKIGQFPMIF